MIVKPNPLDSPDHRLPPAYYAAYPTQTDDTPASTRHMSSSSPSNTAPIDPSSLLLAEHLLLTKKNWAAYKRAVLVLCELRGVDEHLRRCDASSDKTWQDDDTLCRAVILFNIKDDSHLRLDSDPKHACELWNSLVHMHEGKVLQVSPGPLKRSVLAHAISRAKGEAWREVIWFSKLRLILFDRVVGPVAVNFLLWTILMAQSLAYEMISLVSVLVPKLASVSSDQT